MAAEKLMEMGFEIIGRNIRYKFGEIDIVAKRGRELHFVEVKTRTGRMFGDPVEFVTETKKKRIKRAAEMFILKTGNNFNDNNIPPCFFDVIGVDLSGDHPSVECIIDAFE
ncbi:MAG: YraN family protein [Proteobacteria bacterium]|nr:YraN family protein [Pseudomonadota bacterium]